MGALPMPIHASRMLAMVWSRSVALAASRPPRESPWRRADSLS
jgi:hypothetical protein